MELILILHILMAVACYCNFLQLFAITCNAVLSPVHLSVCGKSQEHSTPAFVIFGHSHPVSVEGDDDGDDGNT